MLKKQFLSRNRAVLKGVLSYKLIYDTFELQGIIIVALYTIVLKNLVSADLLMGAF